MIAELLGLKNQTNVFHWQTKAYAEHVALGGLYDKLDDLVDSFVETYSGYVGSVEQGSPAFATSVTNYVDKNDLLAFCDFAIAYLKGPLTKSISPDCTDLLNIVADMIGAFNHTKYLLRLA